MHPALTAVADSRHGVFTMADVTASGHTRSDLHGWLRAGLARRVTRGIYSAHTDAPDARGRLEELTNGYAHRYGDDLVASHHSALLLHGLALHDVPRGTASFLRVHGGAQSHGTLRVWRPRRPPEDVLRVDGIRTVPPALAVAQVAAACGVSAGVVAADSAMERLGLDRASLVDAARTLGHGPGVHAARTTARRARLGAQSPGETLLRLFIEDLGYAVQLQFPVVEDGCHRPFAYADLRIRGTRSLWEFDGAVKYAGLGGGQALFAEKQRGDRITRLGWGVERVIWRELADLRGLAARVRVAAEHWGARRTGPAAS